MMERRARLKRVENVEVTFGAEIEFKGSMNELAKATAALAKLPFRIGDRWPPGHLAGCWPLDIWKFIDRDFLNGAVKDAPRIKAELLRDIRGGIRDPHIHVGNEVALVSREKFGEIVGQIATKLAGKAGYVETVGAIRNMVG